MRIYVFEEDPSLLNLLSTYLINQGHHVKGFSEGYKCPLYLLEECVCPASKPCAEAVIVNTRMPTKESVQILIDQDRRGCKLPKANKAVMSASFNSDQEEYVKQQGFSMIKKPYRLATITLWLKESALRLEERSC